ncbi:gp16 family protein [Phenylobacterium sp. 58.2.17]|uniref:gp16 family protein n=1 Tax=Phenylobacterium sp. 58.2.17 TaxID=2969306 RepID=UPI002264CFC8|nr:regulatory protein GemA [Phenylobacterium sp. 58.2.17]MCX7586563.1 regulatory protein GemA [Phenylobacterium sp. 58.2.17]
MSAARKFAPAGRNPMLAKVHLGAKELGLDDEVRRDLIARVTGGLRSAGDCSPAQLDAILAEYRRLGWKPSTGKSEKSSAFRRAPAQSPFAAKARALWISLHQLGVVRDPSERALEAFAARQLKVDRLQWADEGMGYRLIEALKAMAERAGWEQHLDGIRPARHVWTLKARLVNAQREKLGLGYLPGVNRCTEAELDAMAREQGQTINDRPAN